MSYPFSKCEYVATNRINLIKHVEVRFPCSQCICAATRAGELKKYVEEYMKGSGIFRAKHR